jgi:hypothetical protein
MGYSLISPPFVLEEEDEDEYEDEEQQTLRYEVVFIYSALV